MTQVKYKYKTFLIFASLVWVGLLFFSKYILWFFACSFVIGAIYLLFAKEQLGKKEKR